MSKVPDDHVGVVLTITEDGQAVFSGPGDELPKGASLKAPESVPSPADQVAAIAAQRGEDPEDAEAANDAVVAEAEAKRDADLERVAAQQEASVKPAKKAAAKKTTSSSS